MKGGQVEGGQVGGGQVWEVGRSPTTHAVSSTADSGGSAAATTRPAPPTARAALPATAYPHSPHANPPPSPPAANPAAANAGIPGVDSTPGMRAASATVDDAPTPSPPLTNPLSPASDFAPEPSFSFPADPPSPGSDSATTAAEPSADTADRRRSATAVDLLPLATVDPPPAVGAILLAAIAMVGGTGHHVAQKSLAGIPHVFPYLDLVIAFIAASFAFETLLDLRQFAALLRPSLPPALEGVVSHDKFVKARAYSLDRARLGFVRGAVDFCVELLMLKLFVLPWLWERCALDYQLPYLWGINGRNEIEHSILFLFASSLISQVVDLPFALYSTFVIEHRHGFNKQTLLGFIKDRILGILLMVVILPPVLAACIRIVQVGGNLVAVYLWLFMLAFSLFMLTIYPVAIAPLFNKFTPLEAGTLRSKIEGLAGSLSYPLKKIFVMDGSQRSAHSNVRKTNLFPSHVPHVSVPRPCSLLSPLTWRRPGLRVCIAFS
ncbi:unnamed protein product [Closterium sp. NIES-53]